MKVKGSELLVAAANPSEARVFAKYRRYTMIPPPRYIDNLAAAKRIETDGAIVECGTWKGGMIAGLAELLPGRRCYLFDSFEGLPPARQIDGELAAAYQTDTESPGYFDNCTAAVEDADRAMRMSGADYELRKGWFDNTVPAFAAKGEPIAVLRLDGDWYDSTLVCLRHLFPLVVPGGVVLIDDYGVWEGCTRAVHDYLSEACAVEAIERTASGVAYLWKH